MRVLLAALAAAALVTVGDATAAPEASCDDDSSLMQVHVGVKHGARSQPQSGTDTRDTTAATTSAVITTSFTVPDNWLIHGRQPPTFTVDLDQAPETRWNGVMDYYLDTGLLQAYHANEIQPEFPKLSPELKTAWTAGIRRDADEEFQREAAGMAAYVNSRTDLNVTSDEILLSQYMYEQNYPAFCSGVLAARSNGTVIHGRNLDYPLAFAYRGKTIGWPELTTEVTLVRGGKPLYVSVTWPMQLGIHTAMRFDGWSFEQNTRVPHDEGEDLKALQAGAHGFVLRARRVMETVPDFNTAVNEFWNMSLAAPSYFIISGAKPYEGAVLAVDRFGKHLPGSPPLARLSPGQSSWHIVQTNDDQNKAPLDSRRPIEQLRLNESEQSQVSPAWMLQHMSEAPIMDEDTTAFTFVSSPGMGYHRVTLPEGTINPLTMHLVDSGAEMAARSTALAQFLAASAASIAAASWGAS